MPGAAKELAGEKWSLGKIKQLTMELLWTWAKEDGLEYDRGAYLGLVKCIDFGKEFQFDFGKSMQKNSWSVFQDHVKYIINDIIKPF